MKFKDNEKRFPLNGLPIKNVPKQLSFLHPTARYWTAEYIFSHVENGEAVYKKEKEYFLKI